MTSAPTHSNATPSCERPLATAVEADVCLVVEGCYPYVPGGVSSWLDWLMRTQPDVSFSVMAIVAGAAGRKRRYELPPNVKGFSEIDLLQGMELRRAVPLPSRTFDKDLADCLVALVQGGGARQLGELMTALSRSRLGLDDLVNSRLAWNVLCRMYERIMPQSSFLHFYWAWQSLFGGLLATMTAPLPPARAYHTISTGYAGLFAARASLATGRPAAITEHGIYTNERRIEILTADWIVDTVDKGLSIADERVDLRDLWMKAFDAYARACYDACSVITTLYRDNQALQLSLGADPGKLRVIPNGIEWQRFIDLPRADTTLRPTIALIGRVVPIKDVKTYIAAAAELRERMLSVRVLVLGPTDEDPEYYQECVELVRERGLEEALTFTGNVKLVDYLPQVHVVVLTSLSEAQPLVLLEAGAAGIPCVTTDVGSCREIIEGLGEDPCLGRGGYVTDLVSPSQIAEAIHRLLSDEQHRRLLGETLCKRVQASYGSDRARTAYGNLYADLIAAPGVPSLAGGR